MSLHNFRRTRFEIDAGGGDPAREDLRGPRRVHADHASQRARTFREAAAPSARPPVDRPQVSRASVLLPHHRRDQH